MVTHSSILPWEILWTVEPGGLQSIASQSPTPLQQLNTHTQYDLIHPFTFCSSDRANNFSWIYYDIFGLVQINSFCIPTFFLLQFFFSVAFTCYFIFQWNTTLYYIYFNSMVALKFLEHFLLQGIFPTQVLNLDLLDWKQILYHLSHWEVL